MAGFSILHATLRMPHEKPVKITTLECLHADAGQRDFDFLKISTDAGWSAGASTMSHLAAEGYPQ